VNNLKNKELKDLVGTYTTYSHIVYQLHHEWSSKIPFLPFVEGLKIKSIPPFSRAIIRYCVTDLEERFWASVYLDGYDHLGCYGEPYWEVYFPKCDEEPVRFDLKDVDEMMDYIVNFFEKLKKRDNDNRILEE
jgi:hypothetical protein